ncbi:MAG: LLM class flavin-dependent oxidoreductase, partial [Sneathiella sp.]|uniref:LLM class flavin-dependent oxidoreductase n=1 Tax=Sneathiella sp. TaxID=1964365 RepID=UPI00300285CD
MQSLGAKPDMCIGIFMDRSIEMMVGLLAILKSGAAYVPLDPAYPRDRVGLMIEDANLQILLVHSKLERELPQHSARIVRVDEELNKTSLEQLAGRPVEAATSDNLAYVIYTSGSTGKPKGVMIEHKNAVNFFSAMDDVLEFDGVPGVWLAVTSISFDISVLEIFWTLSRGFKVVLQEEEARTLAQPSVSQVDRKMDVGLFYFSSDAGPSETPNRYRLLMEGAKFADSHGFSSVWTPERHFHLFGGLYPNPSVTSAAVAAVTSNIAIRAGSIVLPLHNPVRVVEEWSVVDNLSGGRVGFSFASGWHANDFSLLPENY